MDTLIFTGSMLFLSTLSLRRATAPQQENGQAATISIHALLAESDHSDAFAAVSTLLISIHALLAESDFACAGWFQVVYYFYPRSPCGERPIKQEITVLTIAISIHALLAESDAPPAPQGKSSNKFLSTLSLRRATHRTLLPLACCGFLSTLSLRRATTVVKENTAAITISIHALLAESDASILCTSVNMNNFYPRSPCGERRKEVNNGRFRQNISIHALLAESDQPRSRKTGRPLLFLSTLSLRRATYFCGPAL